MPRIIEASLILLSAVAVTTAVMVLVFPVHAFGGARSAGAGDGVRAAVLVERAASCPGGMNTVEQCPFLARHHRTAGACPYLSALAAASDCPALSPRDTAAGCPFLSGKELLDPRLKIARAERTPAAESS